MNTSPPPESSSRSAAAPTRTTPGTIVIGSTCWAVMTPMIADPQTPRPSCVYYCTLRTLAPAIHHTKVHVKALDARLGALPCQESWCRVGREARELDQIRLANLSRGVPSWRPAHVHRDGEPCLRCHLSFCWSSSSCRPASAAERLRSTATDHAAALSLRSRCHWRVSPRPPRL